MNARKITAAVVGIIIFAIGMGTRDVFSGILIRAAITAGSAGIAWATFLLLRAPHSRTDS